MEQIYYTQCPVGYGLGASNGFQVKRMSRGYPMSGDFRHLAMKAYPGGARTLAPPALRYRKDGEFAEIAWLTPRPNEYETERGLWGRPGGHFAHGLRIPLLDLKLIKAWPAGLFDASLWARSDPEPSRGRPPQEVEFSGASLNRAATFMEIASLAKGLDPDRLACLLTATARVARDGRTLFLVDQPERLGPLMALLTFAFPERLRGDLTFSTYHDRPEELPGYRISGTTMPCRPNKAALTAQGIVADLILGTFEPKVEPEPWARTLSGWLAHPDGVEEADWSATDARARDARGAPGPETLWSKESLQCLHDYPAATRNREAPRGEAAWRSLAGFLGWIHGAGLGEEWVRSRSPDWWRDAIEAAEPGDRAEARAALVAHACLREAWRGHATPAAWGEVVAACFREVEPGERDRSIVTLLGSAPKSARPAFARSLLAGLTPEGAETTLAHLRADPSVDRAMLLPLEASASVAAILQGVEGANLPEIVEEAREWPGATSALLDAVEAGIASRPDLLENFTPLVSDAFRLESGEGIAWALRRGELATVWLSSAFRPLFADPGRRRDWQDLHDRTPEELRPALARAILAITRDEGLPDQAFRWGIEACLLPLAPRPKHSSWANEYLRRIPSGLDLLRRLVAPEYRKLGVLAWIDQARGRGEVSAEQGARVDACLDYARALKSGDPNALLKVELPAVPLAERATLLDQVLKHVGGSKLEGLPFVLEAARQAWPGAFDAGSPGLRDLAAPLARCLQPLRLSPSSWLDRTRRILDQLGLQASPQSGFGPDGLAAELFAATVRQPEADIWAFRKELLNDDLAWRALAVDVRSELEGAALDDSPEVLDRWDRQLDKDPGRFFELFLNAAPPHSRARLVTARAADLRTLGRLSWWDHSSQAETLDDFRDGYARTVPLAPLGEGRLSIVRQWIQGSSAKVADEDGSVFLSPRGLARWRCLEALTLFVNAGEGSKVRWRIIQGWEADLPLGSIPVDDRYRFASWLILGLDEAEPWQLSKLVSWLRKHGMKDSDRLARWAEELDGLVEVPDRARLFRARMVSELCGEFRQQLREAKSREGPRPNIG